MNLIQQQIQQPVQCGGLPFERTYCSCNECREYCKLMPGYLILDDVIAIYHYLNPAVSFNQYYKLYFLASPGAIVMKNGKIGRIGTLVPRRKLNGNCIFFTAEQKCQIHPVAPFGCRYFDHSTTKKKGDSISQVGLELIFKSKKYFEIWKELCIEKLYAIPPEKLRDAEGYTAREWFLKQYPNALD